MKNVLILSSSPRRGGNSDTLCDEFMQGAIESGHRVEKVFLRDKTIHPCTGCGVCSQYKKPCPQKDDAAEIIGKMLAADVIVMATPVYFYAMSAQMKTLIDRCCGPYTEMKNKEFYFIATAAEEDNGIMDRIVANFMGFLDCLENPTVKGTLFCGGVWGRGRREPDFEASIRAGKTSIILLIATNTSGYNPYRRPTSMGSEYGSPFLRDLFLVLQLYPFREDRESRRVGRRTWQRKREGCPLLPK